MPNKRTRVYNSTKAGHFVNNDTSISHDGRLHVVQQPTGGWTVKQGGRLRNISTFSTKKEAVAAARNLSRSRSTGFVVHRRDGSVQRAVPAEGRSQPSSNRPDSGFGCARGLIKLSPDFDAPLDDFSEYA